MSKGEKITQFAVVVIAVCAVVVSVWQGRIAAEQSEIARKHNRLTVKPYLDFFYGWYALDDWKLTLSNEGIGPAIIKKVSYKYDGETYHNWDDVLRAADLLKARTGSYNMSPDSPFAVDKTVVFLRLNIQEESVRTIGIEILIEYESVYEEPFELTIKI